MSFKIAEWLCCQLGAREHYAIPRALSRLKLLEGLVTDAWVKPSSLPAKLSGSWFADRFHEELRDAPVTSYNWSLIQFEVLTRLRRLGEWGKIIARNQWFQQNVCSFFRSQLSTLNDPPIVVSYSYTALEPFRHAKSRGCKTVLVQID